MDTFDKIFISFILILFISLSTAVIYTASEIKRIATEVIEEREQKERRHLPTECRHLYDNDTSEEWMDCMGVGYK